MSGATIRMHGRSHRLGGSDPVPMDWSEIWGKVTDQAVTAGAEMEFDEVTTNDRKLYAWDPDDPAGLVVKRPGVYIAFAYAQVSSGDSSVQKSITVMHGTVASGPFGGSEFGRWFTDGGGTDTSPNSVSATSEAKTRLSQIAIGSFLIAPPTLERMALLLSHPAGNYTVTNGGLRIVRIGAGGTTPPLPPT